MTHEQIEANDIIDRFVSHQLNPAERQAFQEHYFDCTECFEQVQAASLLIAGVRRASRKGLLSDPAAQETAQGTRSWWALLSPAMGFGAALVIILAVAGGWYLHQHESSPTPDIASGQQPELSAPRPDAGRGNNPIDASSPKGAEGRTENQPVLTAMNDVPAVLLESVRDAGKGNNELTIPAAARSADLKIEIAPDASLDRIQFEISDSSRQLVASAVTKSSSNGAVTARISTERLQTGTYSVNCYGLRGGQKELLGNYTLQVIRQ